MANIPFVATLTNAAPDVINAIANELGAPYTDYVPYATDDPESIREIGKIIMDSPDLRNQFIQTLVNRIGKVIVTSKLYDNPWAVFKKGVLDYGEIIENIFIELAKPFTFNPDTAENTLFRRQIPDVKTAFHVLNFQKYYKDTIDDKQLSLAFLSWGAVTDFINKIISSMYTAANYDEFLVMKFMIAKAVFGDVNDQIYAYNEAWADYADPNKGLVIEARANAKKMTFMNKNYNAAGVRTHSAISDLYMVVTPEVEAQLDVEVLAMAFNMDKAEFLGHVITIDYFTVEETARLAELFRSGGTDLNPTYDGGFDPADLEDINAKMDLMRAMLVDKDWFMIYDNFIEMASMRNPEGLYWNYWLHTWKTFAINPYAQCLFFRAPSNADSGDEGGGEQGGGGGNG